MKALMVNSTNGNIISQKMRDEMYMKHLREVQKINNRQAQKISKDIKGYKSITHIHSKHKQYSYDWQHRVKDQYINQRNHKIKQKIGSIKSYVEFPHPHHRPKDPETEKDDIKIHQEQLVNIINSRGQTSPSYRNNKKQRISLHYQYRKKRQEQIDHQNDKLQKGILSQKSTYLPKIKLSNRYHSRMNESRDYHKEQEQTLSKGIREQL